MGSQDVEGAEGDPPARTLDWLGRLLLAGSAPDEGVIVAETPPPGYRSALAFRALPNARHPYLLLPLDSRAAAAASVHHIGNPTQRRVRVAESALSLSFQIGVGQRVLNRQLHVCVPRDVTMDGPTLLERARRIVGRDDLSAAVILGRDRPNRKPVLKLLAPDGEPVAFAKVGWNEISRALVRHEADVLSAMATAERRPLSFRVPSVIGFDSRDGIDLLLVAPMPQASGLRGGPPSRVPMRATQEVAMAGGVSWSTLEEAPYWTSLGERLASASRDSVNPLRAEQQDAFEQLERSYGAREMPFGSWHGDWTPWNMTLVGGTLSVWDWERAEGSVPMGLDLMHFDFDVRVKIRGHAPSRAIHGSILDLGPGLEALGLPSGLTHLLATLHVLEMTLRFQQARAQGVDIADAIYGPALLAILRSRSAA